MTATWQRGYRSCTVCCSRKLAKLAVMDLHLTPETEAKLNELSLRTHRDTDELLREAVNHLLTYSEWVERKVNASVAAVENGETVRDEEVRAWLVTREHS